jgi:hypothetical protein
MMLTPDDTAMETAQEEPDQMVTKIGEHAHCRRQR